MRFPYPCALKREIEYPIGGRCCHINKGQREHAGDFFFFWWRDQDIKQNSSREDGHRFFLGRSTHGEILFFSGAKEGFLGFEKEKEGEDFFWRSKEIHTEREATLTHQRQIFLLIQVSF